jgi:hypothetical protein
MPFVDASFLDPQRPSAQVSMNQHTLREIIPAALFARDR